MNLSAMRSSVYMFIYGKAAVQIVKSETSTPFWVHEKKGRRTYEEAA